MEWEEALLKARGGDLPREPANLYYRRQAARARHFAEGEVAANADGVAEELAASTRTGGKAA